MARITKCTDIWNTRSLPGRFFGRLLVFSVHHTLAGAFEVLLSLCESKKAIVDERKMMNRELVEALSTITSCPDVDDTPDKSGVYKSVRIAPDEIWNKRYSTAKLLIKIK